MPAVSSYFAIANLDYALRVMGEGDHLITALFKRVLWKVDSSDYMRTGRLDEAIRMLSRSAPTIG